MNIKIVVIAVAGTLLGCATTAQEHPGASSVLRLSVTNTHPSVLEGVSVELVRSNGSRELLCATDDSGGCDVDRARLRDAGDGFLLFCKERYFCGALKLGTPGFLDKEGHLIVLAPYAIS